MFFRFLILFIYFSSKFVIADPINVYYSDKIIDLKISDTDPTLFSFDSPPISASCQPSKLVNFESLVDPVENTIDKLNNASSQSKHNIRKTRHFLKLIPNEDIINQKTKNNIPEDISSTDDRPIIREVKCSFFLLNDRRFTTRLFLSEDNFRPSVHFQSLDSKIESKSKRKEALIPALSIMKSMINGKILNLYDISDNISYLCLNETRTSLCTSNLLKDRNASYKILYVGTNKEFIAWKIAIKFKTMASFESLNEINLPTGKIVYSAVMPQNRVFMPEQFATLYLITSFDTKLDEIERALKGLL